MKRRLGLLLASLAATLARAAAGLLEQETAVEDQRGAVIQPPPEADADETYRWRRPRR